jgi:hypothetical protein
VGLGGATGKTCPLGSLGRGGPAATTRKEDAMRGCGCLIVALAGLFLALYIAGSLLTAALH